MNVFLQGIASSNDYVAGEQHHVSRTNGQLAQNGGFVGLFHPVPPLGSDFGRYLVLNYTIFPLDLSIDLTEITREIIHFSQIHKI